MFAGIFFLKIEEAIVAEGVVKLGGKKKSRFMDKVMEILPEGGNLNLCLTCGACSSGCPATGLDGLDPRKFLRRAQRHFRVPLRFPAVRKATPRLAFCRPARGIDPERQKVCKLFQTLILYKALIPSRCDLLNFTEQFV